MKNKIFIINYVIYPFDVLVCLGSSRDQVLGKLKKLGVHLDDKDKDLLIMSGVGRTVMLDKGQTILWLKKYPKVGCDVMAHEVFHAVEFLLSRIGMPLTRDSSEAYAYLIQYLTKSINIKL